MPDFLQDYKAYYAARAQRYAAQPDYPLTAKAEADLNNAMQSCGELSEFRSKIGNLNDLCAVALVKDQYKIRYDHYITLKETIRALGPQRIVGKASAYDNVSDLISMITEEENKNSVEISMDHISPFDSDWFVLERIELYEKAEVPEKWKQDQEESAERERNSVREGFTLTETEMKKWEPRWTFNKELVSEERHRRLLPYPDSEVEKRLSQFLQIVNR